MGKRDQHETVAGVMKAFADTATWKQADLAQHLGIEARSLRKILENLSFQGRPFERQDGHPHAMRSVPRQGFPGGLFFELDDWEVRVQAA